MDYDNNTASEEISRQTKQQQQSGEGNNDEAELVFEKSDSKSPEKIRRVIIPLPSTRI